jgi:MoxR-like ATPase
MLSKPFPQLPSIDVRRLLAERGVDGVAELLQARAGYVPQRRPLVELAEAVSTGRPLRCLGEAGCGKTAFGRALRYALNVTLYYLQCHEDLKTDEMLYYWLDANGPRTRENLVLCDPLAAYDHCMTDEDVPVLIIDEVDKTTRGSEFKLLEVLETRQATIPNLRPASVVGIPEGTDHLGPIVIITSNDERELSDPFLSRCLTTYFQAPTPREEVAILRSRVPRVNEHLLRQFVKLLHCIRHSCNMDRKPGIRESITLLGSLVRKGVDDINWAVVDAHLGHIAKTPGDFDNLQLKKRVIEDSVYLPHDEIDGDVALAFASCVAAQEFVEV